MVDYSNLNLLGQGNTADIYEINSMKVLKLFKAEMPLTPCKIEFDNSVIVNELLPNMTPKVYELVNHDNRNGIVFEKIYGQDMMDIMSKKLFSIKHYSKKLAKIHTIIHSQKTNKIINVKDKLVNDIKMGSILSEDEKHKLYKYIETLPNGNALCHFDFHPGNIMINENIPKIIDWMTACYGSRYADIARTETMLLYAKMPRGNIFIKKISSAVQKHILKEYLNELVGTTNLDMSEVARWRLPIMAARLMEWIPEEEKAELLSLVKISLLKL